MTGNVVNLSAKRANSVLQAGFFNAQNRPAMSPDLRAMSPDLMNNLNLKSPAERSEAFDSQELLRKITVLRNTPASPVLFKTNTPALNPSGLFKSSKPNLTRVVPIPSPESKSKKPTLK